MNTFKSYLNIKTLLIIFSVLFLAACGDANTMVSTEGPGFLGGLWDGLTSYIAILNGIVSSNVNMYEVVNDGNWYNAGFIIGTWGAAVVLVLACCAIGAILSMIVAVLSK